MTDGRSLNIVRLDSPYTTRNIPVHDALSAAQTEKEKKYPIVNVFVGNVLDAGLNFLSTEIPAFDAAKGKESKGSKATVSLKTWKRGSENWVARKSIHKGRSEAGDATLEEFENGLKHNHSENEKDYTPTILDAHQVCKWTGDEIGAVTGWEDVDCAIYEMKHKMPTPLEDRIFTILTTSGYDASSKSKRSFVTVTVPVTLKTVDKETRIEASKYSEAPSIVHGAYVSVEHVYQQEDGQIVWIMGTASDAKGVLPVSVQKFGVPSAITKDVGFLLTWINDKRNTKATTEQTSA